METTIVYWVYIGRMENEMETTIVYSVYIEIMENDLETTIVYWGYIGIVENKMETTSHRVSCKSCRTTCDTGSRNTHYIHSWLARIEGMDA